MPALTGKGETRDQSSTSAKARSRGAIIRAVFHMAWKRIVGNGALGKDTGKGKKRQGKGDEATWEAPKIGRKGAERFLDSQGREETKKGEDIRVG